MQDNFSKLESRPAVQFYAYSIPSIVGLLLTSGIVIIVSTILWFYPAMMINIVFAIFLRAQGNPGLSLLFGVAGNALNVFLDYFMIARWGMGLRGAALASGISALIPMCFGFLYFLSRHSVLQFKKFPWQWWNIGRILFNGSSEMIVQISTGITTGVFNRVFLSRMGVDGVAAYAIVGYIAFVQIMIVTGFATGLGPIVGYSFGAGKKAHIIRVMRIALISAFISGAICWAMVFFFPAAIAALFSPGSGNIRNLAESGFSLFSAAFLLNGFNILITAYFTSIGNAKISLVISAMRGLILINIFILVLPLLMGDAGIWASYPLAELVTLIFAVGFMRQRADAAVPVRNVLGRSTGLSTE